MGRWGGVAVVDGLDSWLRICLVLGKQGRFGTDEDLGFYEGGGER